MSCQIVMMINIIPATFNLTQVDELSEKPEPSQLKMLHHLLMIIIISIMTIIITNHHGKHHHHLLHMNIKIMLGQHSVIMIMNNASPAALS